MARKSGRKWWQRAIDFVTRRNRDETPEPPLSPIPPGGGGGGGPTPPEPPYDGGGDGDSYDPWDLPGAGDLPFDFTLAGWLPLDGTYNEDYVNLEGAFTIDITDSGDVDWSGADYVVVQVVEPNGTSYYTTFVGPFVDYWDFYAQVETWWTEGSP